MPSTPTLVRLTSVPVRVQEGAELALLAHVRQQGADREVPTGSVTFLVGRRTLGTAVLDSSGCARLDGVLLEAGVHAVTATYGGDDRHASAVSAPLPQAVTVAAARVAVLVPRPRPVAGGTLLEAELVDNRSGRLVEAACGPLVFRVGGTVVAVAGLQDGRAQVVVPVLPEGRLRVAFAGDAEHAPASGSPTEGPA